MRLKELEFSNLYSYGKDNIVIFPKDKKLVAFCGLNGMGKSSIFEIMNFLLFDKTVKEEKVMNRIVRRGEKNGYGCLKLVDDQKKILSIKKYKGKQSKCIVSYGGKRLERRTATITKGLLDNILGISFSIWRNSILAGQSDKNKFLDGTPKEKKDTLGKIVGFEDIDKVLKGVRTKLMGYNHMSEKYSNRIIAYKEQEDKTDYKREIIRVKRKIKELGEKLVYSNNRVEYIVKELRQFEVLQMKKDEIKRELDSNTMVCRRIIDLLDNDLKEVDTDRVDFKGGICPMCLTKLSKGQIESCCEKRIKVIKGKINTEKNKIEKLNYAYKKKIDSIVINKDKENELRGDLSEVNNYIKNGERELFSLQHDLRGFVEKKKIQLLHGDKVDKYKKLSKKYNKLIQQYNQLETIFGQDGLRLWLLDRLLEVVEVEVNNNLNYITDMDMRIKFLQKPFDILIQRDNKEFRWDEFSGGERGLLTIAFQLAFGTIISEKTSFKFLLLDEILTDLDKHHIKKVLRYLEMLSEERGLYIYLISNQIYVLESMLIDWHKVIVGKRENGISYIK